MHKEFTKTGHTSLVIRIFVGFLGTSKTCATILFSMSGLGYYKTIIQTIYGCGLRLSEVLKLRIKDIDFDYNRMIIWDSKSLNDRSLPLPQKLITAFKQLIKSNQLQHQKDLTDGVGTVEMPNALARKLPNANKEFKWQYLFPMAKVSKDPKSSIIRRHHVLESTFSRNLKRAVVKSAVNKKVTAHTFRHSYATHLLQAGIENRTIQALFKKCLGINA